MHLALFVFVAALLSAHVKVLLFWLAAAASAALFGTTIAFPGYGSKLASGGTTGASYTNIAQLKKVNFSGFKAEFDDITNLDSPTIFKEWLKTVVDGDTITFDGVLNPADPTTQTLLSNISTAGSSALFFWKLSTTDGSTFVFTAYVQDFKFGVEYNKAMTFSGTLKIVGNISATWS
jgi:predicted secreted protein